MNSILILSLGIANYILSFLLVRTYSHFALKQGHVDIPNERSSHNIVTPRGAGVVFVLLWICTLLLSFAFGWISSDILLIFLPGIILVSGLGYWDDIKSLPSKTRLVVQLVIAALSVYTLEDMTTLHLFSDAKFELGFLGTLFSIIGIVWSINLFNFMDGLDGLAGVKAVFVFGLGGFLFWSYDVVPMAWLCWFLVLAIFGFLNWNWPKARVFMGDAGSYFLGFLIALFALVGDVKYQIPITLWIILYGVFWFDATITVIRRALMGDKIIDAHRLHAYQRLHQAKYTPHQILYGVIMINSILASIVLWVRYYPDYLWLAFLVTVILLSGIYIWVEKKTPMRKQ